MRTITLRQLSEHLFTELKDLPLEVTRYGKPYVMITSRGTLDIDIELDKAPSKKDINAITKYFKEKKKENNKKLVDLDLSKEYNPVK